MPISEPLDDLSWREIRTVLDEEIARLAEKHRGPLVLCYLEGKSYEQAARELGWAKTTLRRRLDEARELMRERLVRRGITLSAGALATVLCEKLTVPAVGAMLTINTVKAAVSMAAGKAVAVGFASAQAVALAEKTMTGIGMIKVKVFAITLTIAVGVVGAGVAGYGTLVRSEPPGKAAQAPRKPAEVKNDSEETKKAPPHTDLYGDPLPEGALARLGTVRFRQSGEVFAIAYSPDGKILASAGFISSALNLWDAVTGKRLHECQVSPFSLDFVFSPDGKLIATDNGVIVDVATGLERLRFSKGAVGPVIFAPDGNTLLTARYDDKTVRVTIRDVATGKELRKFEVENGGQPQQIEVTNLLVGKLLEFSPDAKILASVTPEGTVRLWDIATAKELRSFAGNGKRISSVAFSPVGKTVAVAREDGVVRLFDRVTGEVLQEWTPEAGVPRKLVFSPDSKQLAMAGFDGFVRLWDVASAKEIYRWATSQWSRQMAFSPDGKVLAVGGGFEHVIRRWDSITGREINPVAAHNGEVGQVLFSPDDASLFSCGSDTRVLEWDLTKSQPRRFLVKKAVESPTIVWGLVHLAKDPKTLAFVKYQSQYNTTKNFWPEQDRVIRVWDVTADKEILGLKVDQHVTALRLSEDGKLLVAAVESGIRVWDLTTGKELPSPKYCSQWPLVALSPDAQLLGYTGSDKSIRLWDVAKGKLVRRWEGETRHLVFSPDGKMLASSDTVWSVESGKVLRQIPSQGLGRSSLAFSPSGRIIAASGPKSRAGAHDGFTSTIQLIEIYSGEEVWRVERPSSSNLPVAFSSDGRMLASGDGDSSILLWDLTHGMLDGKAKPFSLTKAQLENLWSNLAADAREADKAIWMLAAAPKRERAAAGGAPTTNCLCIGRANCQVGRRSGRQELQCSPKGEQSTEDMGEAAEVGLRMALETNIPREVRQRIEQILEKRSQEEVRKLRAIEALEQIGIAQAREVLLALANGSPNPRVAEAASAALRRLAQRQK